MYQVTMQFNDDLFIEADDYEVESHSGDLVFFADEGDVDEANEEVLTEVGRVASGQWTSVFQVAEDDEDEDEDEDGEDGE